MTKRCVPPEVEPQLDPYLHQWEDTTSEGWYPWRLDVLLVNIIEAVFSMVAIFFFTTRLVLYEVKSGIFPLLYVAVLVLSAIYKVNTQNLLHDKTLTTKLAVRRNYLIWHLWIDLLVVVLCFLEFFHVASGPFRLVAFLKLGDIMNVLDKCEVIISVRRTGVILWKLLSIFLLNMLVAHIIALIVFAMVEDGQTPNWMAANNLLRSHSDWSSVYVWGFYWGTTIMLTIGFGDLTAKNPKEAIVVAFVEMVSVITFAYCINAIQSLLVSLREFDEAKTHNLGIVNRYMNTNHVPYSLQAEVKKTIGHMTDTEKSAKV